MSTTSVVDALLPFFRWASSIVSFESIQLNYVIAERLFPMNSGDLGFYLGIMLGFLGYPRARRWLHRHHDLKWYAIASLPFVSYWLLVIRVQRFLFGLERVNEWIIPPSRELYTVLGIACGTAAVFYVLRHLTVYHDPKAMHSWLKRWNLVALTFVGISVFLAAVIDGRLGSIEFVFLGMASSLGVFGFLILIALYSSELLADLFVGTCPRPEEGN